MTEAEWLSCDDPDRMLAFLARPAGDRATRWFTAAACRRVEGMGSHSAVTEAIALAEAAAEGPVSPESLATAKAAAFAVWREFRRPNSARHAAGAAWRAVGDDEGYARAVADWVRGAAGHLAAEAAPRGARKAAKEALRAAAKEAESRALAGLLRDVVGNPFRPVRLDPHWRTSDVTALAWGIHEGRTFDRLPILGDALEEAGCGLQDLLGHCRCGGPHVRGCWAVDLCLRLS